MSNFKIDFFELMFLAEACIPPVPIARGMFWDRLIDTHYHELCDEQRKHAFDWMTKLDRFDKNNKDCQRFFARFNPENQYIATCFHQGKAGEVQCYRFYGRFMTGKNTFINPEYIKKVELIKNR